MPALAALVAFTVKVEFPAPPAMDDFVKVEVTLAGLPLTVKATAPLKPDRAAIVNESVMEEPFVTDNDEDAAVNVKSPIVIVLFTVVVWPIVSVAVNTTI